MCHRQRFTQHPKRASDVKCEDVPNWKVDVDSRQGHFGGLQGREQIESQRRVASQRVLGAQGRVRVWERRRAVWEDEARASAARLLRCGGDGAVRRRRRRVREGDAGDAHRGAGRDRQGALPTGANFAECHALSACSVPRQMTTVVLFDRDRTVPNTSR